MLQIPWVPSPILKLCQEVLEKTAGDPNHLYLACHIWEAYCHTHEGSSQYLPFFRVYGEEKTQHSSSQGCLLNAAKLGSPKSSQLPETSSINLGGKPFQNSWRGVVRIGCWRPADTRDVQCSQAPLVLAKQRHEHVNEGVAEAWQLGFAHWNWTLCREFGCHCEHRVIGNPATNWTRTGTHLVAEPKPSGTPSRAARRTAQMAESGTWVAYRGGESHFGMFPLKVAMSCWFSNDMASLAT